MIEILLVSENKALFSTLTDLLGQFERYFLQVASSGDAALEAVKNKSLKLVIIDEKIEGKSGIPLAESIVSQNPMVNLALVSDLPEESFHEATEGLGVLSQLPSKPALNDVENLLGKLHRILDMME